MVVAGDRVAQEEKELSGEAVVGFDVRGCGDGSGSGRL